MFRTGLSMLTHHTIPILLPGVPLVNSIWTLSVAWLLYFQAVIVECLILNLGKNIGIVWFLFFFSEQVICSTQPMIVSNICATFDLCIYPICEIRFSKPNKHKEFHNYNTYSFNSFQREETLESILRISKRISPLFCTSKAVIIQFCA